MIVFAVDFSDDNASASDCDAATVVAVADDDDGNDAFSDASSGASLE